MSHPASRLPARPSLEHLRKQAKDLLHAYRARDDAAVQRVRNIIQRVNDASRSEIALGDAQFVLAREYGFESWAALAQHVEQLDPSAQLSPPHRPPIRPIELRSSQVVKIGR